MVKQESGFKVIAVLVIIAMFSAVLLAYVNTATRGPIEANKKAETKKAITLVLQGIELKNIPDTPQELMIDNSIVKYFSANSDSGQFLGAAFIVKGPNGFTNDFDVMVGVGADGSVIDTYVLDHKETPGLGDKMAHEPFKSQFRQKNLANMKWHVKKDGGDIDALTAATITSRAFTQGVKRALLAYEVLNKKMKEE